MMKRFLGIFSVLFFFITIILFSFVPVTFATNSAPLLLNESTKEINMYPSIDILKLDNNDLTIHDILSDQYIEKFVPANEVVQKRGFFYRVNWLRFEIKNETDKNNWLLEFAFPLVNELELYEIVNNEPLLVYK